jgi:hypothetical protein
MDPTVAPLAIIGAAITVVVIIVLERSSRAWNRSSRMASVTIVLRCLRATSPTNPVPIGVALPTSFALPGPRARRHVSTSPSAIQMDPPCAPSASSTVLNTVGSSSSKSSEPLNS